MRTKSLAVLAWVLAPIGLAALPAPLHAAAPVVEWESLLSVNFGLAFWTVVTFGVMVFVLRRYAWKPLLSALDAREQGIQDSIDDAKRQREEAAALLAQHREQLADGRRQAQAMMAESREAADRLRKDLEQKARADVRSMLASARLEIERERKAAVDAVRREAVDVALAAASRLVAERLDGERDRRLVVGYIDQLGGAGGARA